jgi:UDP-N-acetylglucosamine--N-acetylmuramyl-(pentapeptide) pyrophosphoryl-undecaprenol N-acetylglucosamine transferase
MSNPKKYIISGGGTGGHIYPAIAIADELKKRNPKNEILFVGAKNKMEMTKVPAAGYPIEGLWIAGIQRTSLIKNVNVPFKMLDSLLKSYRILKKFKPNAVIGTGGFASGPLLLVAGWLGIPTLIQEQNSYPGVTNRSLSKKAKSICVAYSGLERFFPKEKIKLTGNPVRNDLLTPANRENAANKWGLERNQKTLLVLGGSLGASKINELIALNIEWFKTQNIQLLWQCGSLYFEKYKHLNETNIRVLAYLDHMPEAYAMADVILSRAGASTVSELCLIQKPICFVPSPNVAADHQTHNAQHIVKQGGAVILIEKEATEKMKEVLMPLFDDNERILTMKKALSALAKPNATEDIVNEIEKIEL